MALLVAGELLASACAAVNNAPLTVSLAELTTDEGAYNGHEVATRGTIRHFEGPDGTGYNTIEDAIPNRVQLEPASASDPYLGQQVDVIGIFHFDDQHGRTISVERISLIPR
jgi:hypothetical protein